MYRVAAILAASLSELEQQILEDISSGYLVRSAQDVSSLRDLRLVEWIEEKACYQMSELGSYVLDVIWRARQ